MRDYNSRQGQQIFILTSVQLLVRDVQDDHRRQDDESKHKNNLNHHLILKPVAKCGRIDNSVHVREPLISSQSIVASEYEVHSV